MLVFRQTFFSVIVLFLLKKDISFARENNFLKNNDNDVSDIDYSVNGKLDIDSFQILNWKLIHSTLNDIRLNMRINQIGKAGEYSYICLKIGPKVLLSFESSAMKNALNYEVTRIELSNSGDKNRKDCVVEKNLSSELSFKNGLKLGVKKDDIVKVMGKPHFISKTKIRYAYRTTSVPQLEKGIERSLWSEVEFALKEDAVAKISVSANYFLETL